MTDMTEHPEHNLEPQRCVNLPVIAISGTLPQFERLTVIWDALLS